MLESQSLLAFIAASLVVLVIPGPGVMYVVARSLGQGIAAGIISAAGLSAGVLVHVVAAAIGLSTILLASSTAFSIIKFLGAAYLAWLGIQMLRSGTGKADIRKLPETSRRRMFVDGVVVSTFNPKIALFFLAYLPQFVDAGSDAVASRIVFLGLLYAVLAFFSDSVYGIFAGSFRKFLSTRVAVSRLLNKLGGAMLIGLGVKTALSRAP